MKRSKILVIIISIFVLTLTGCGKAGGEKNQEYRGVIAGLGDDEQFALEDIGEKEDVLFTTDLTYDDGLGHSAALYSDAHTSHTKIRHTTINYAALGIWKRFFQFSGSLLIKRDTSSAIWHSDAL